MDCTLTCRVSLQHVLLNRIYILVLVLVQILVHGVQRFSLGLRSGPGLWALPIHPLQGPGNDFSQLVQVGAPEGPHVDAVSPQLVDHVLDEALCMFGGLERLLKEVHVLGKGPYYNCTTFYNKKCYYTTYGQLKMRYLKNRNITAPTAKRCNILTYCSISRKLKQMRDRRCKCSIASNVM